MWIYQQKTGNLIAPDGTRVAKGYAGFGPGKNNPDLETSVGIGPIPCGDYAIRAPLDTPSHGPYVLGLTPDPGNHMHGRSGFLIHGDSKTAPGTASHGCIILPRDVRERVWGSGDCRLRVVA